jgi:predicted RNA-binding Zn-ribbon protein involved in translation (DUF1610 family)
MTRFDTRCPNCSGSISFAWAHSVQAVCPHCRSVVVRVDVNLTALGQVATVPPDVSPVQIGTRGRFDGRAFDVVGRVIYEYADGGWNEWHLLFDDGENGWLSDAQAEYAVSRLAGPGTPLPPADALQPGHRFRFEGRDYVATTITTARYAGVEGELPFVTWDREHEVFADLKTTTGHVGTIDYTEDPPFLFLGRFVEFDDLSLTNLREAGSLLRDASVRGFNCSACGAPIALRAGQHTTSVACPSCGTIVNPRDPALQIVQEAASRQRHVPKIPLGRRATLDGIAWDAIGFQHRTITVEGVDYGWDEYLLFNPYRGFRYISEYQGHWNVIRPLKVLPEGDRAGRAELDGRGFKRFQRATATTRVVYGEFPWQVRSGDKVEAIDFVAPPMLLSCERDGSDETWSLGTYTPGAVIWSAFALHGAPPRPVGVFANQPSPHAGRPRLYWRVFGVLVLLWLALVAGRCLQSDGRVVYEGAYSFTKADPNRALVTPEFEVPGGVSNVEVSATAPSLNNDWASLAMALVNLETGEALDFGIELSYYAGVEDGEQWSEGSRDGRELLPSVPSGRYLLRIEPDGGDTGQAVPYTVRVRRDVTRVWYPLLALLLIAIPPIAASLAAAGFERRRWAESGDVDDEGSTDDEDSDESDED